MESIVSDNESGATKAIGDKQFLALLKHAEENRTRVQSINGEVGERVKHAVENAGLNKRAFAIIRAADRMDEIKRADFFAALDLYRDYMAAAVWSKEEHLGDLADMAAEDPDEAAAAENTARLEAGIKPLEDDAAPEPAEDSEDYVKGSRPRRRAAPVGDAAGSYKLN